MFIPGRAISNNIILAHELVKRYTRKYLSPRSMIKVDLQKAYDSIEWDFVIQILRELRFSRQMVKWIMMGISTVSYTFLINGNLSNS